MKKLNFILMATIMLLLLACSSYSVVIKEHWTLDDNGVHLLKNIRQYIPDGYLYMPEGAFTSECMYLHGFSGKIISDGPRFNSSYIWIDTLPDKTGQGRGSKYKFTQLQESVIIKKSMPDFLVSQFEESIRQYRQYLYFLKKDSSPACYLKALPDTTIMEREHEFQYNDIYIGSEYFHHPGYENAPIVGITHAQAEAYCRWKSIYVSNKICEKEHLHFRKDSLLVTFRLPTLSEWEYVLRFNRAYGRLYPKGYNWKSEKMYLLETESEIPWYFPKNRITIKDKFKSYYYTYPENVTIQKSRMATNLNNMSENVSEWLAPNEYVANRGNTFAFKLQRDTSVYENEFIFAGGSFMYPEPVPETYTPEYVKSGLNSNSRDHHRVVPIFVRATPKDRAFSTVGFRCVMEVRGK